MTVTGSRNVSPLKILGLCSHFGVTANAMPADELLKVLPQQQLPIQTDSANLAAADQGAGRCCVG